MARYDPAGTGHNPDASGPEDDGRIRWEREPASSVGGRASPILAGGTIYVVGRRSIVALDRELGDVQFTRRGSYQSTPARATASAYRTDTLAVYGREGIYGLNAGGGYELLGTSFGAERWHGPAQEPGYRTSAAPGLESPVAADGTVYAVVPNTNRLVALDANSGSTRWEYAIGDERSSHPTSPVVRDGTVYVTSNPSYAVAVDAETGSEEWFVELDRDEHDVIDYREVRAPTATSRGLVVPSKNAVSLLDPADGELEWEFVHEGTVTDGRVAVADGSIFAADATDSLFALDLETGEEVWSAEYTADASPVVADGVVYVSSYWPAELVAFDAETGEERWTWTDRESESPGTSQPIVGDGVLYVVLDDRVVALEEAA